MNGWHFLNANGCLGYGDGRKVVVGETLTVDCKPVLCQSGLHASARIIDALSYAPGPVCSYVELGGEIVRGEDKSVATERRTIWMADISHLLFEAACRFAETALLREREAGREPDSRSWAAIDVRRKWLRGEATDEELDAASAAARDAVSAAARDAVSAAARDAAWAAARDAASAAASAAAWAAARDAASAAASAAARDAASAAASAAARDAASAAAWAAARDAASAAERDAARDAQNALLESMVRELMEAKK